jgi:hypothetical protein
MIHSYQCRVMDTTSHSHWLLLIHQIPPQPAYLRVKVGRRLAKVGAVALKNSVYVLPETDAALEDLQWIAREIAEDGGEASISAARFVDGLGDEDIRRLFRRARQTDYDEIAATARTALSGTDASAEAGSPATFRELGRLQRRLEETMALDFFQADGRAEAETALMTLRGRLAGPAPTNDGADKPLQRFRGRTWVTRTGVKVDRIASAWLIRRFIDPDARFRFVPAQGYVPQSGELRFDMFEAEFTHEGDACTFEVLLRQVETPHPALLAIGEIVHDIDLKDGKYGRPEAAGISQLIDGICARTPDDLARIERGSALLEDLLAGVGAADSRES